MTSAILEQKLGGGQVLCLEWGGQTAFWQEIILEGVFLYWSKAQASLSSSRPRPDQAA